MVLIARFLEPSYFAVCGRERGALLAAIPSGWRSSLLIIQIPRVFDIKSDKIASSRKTATLDMSLVWPTVKAKKPVKSNP
jgi:hypothetical protein